MIEFVRNRLEIDIIKKHDCRRTIKHQSKLTFSGIHKSYEK